MATKTNDIDLALELSSTSKEEHSRSSGMGQPRGSRSPSEEGERENDVAQQRSSMKATEGADSPAASPGPDDPRAASPSSEAPIVLGSPGVASPGVASSRATRGSRAPSSASVSQEEDESSGSDDGSSDEAVGRRMKSSVAQIMRGPDDQSANRGRSPTPDDMDGDRRSSRSRSRSRSRERDRRHGGGGYGRSREDDRNRDRYYERQLSRDREAEFRRRGRSPSPAQKDPAAEEPPVKKKKEELDPILTRTGGAYIPPAKLRMMQAQITDKSSLAYQRMSWEALKKSINGLINKVNVSNIAMIIQELLQENIVRGRGLLARSTLQAQSASATFTHVYAAVVAIINSKFPQIGELILKRLILNFRKGYRRNDKAQCLTASKFVAHLVNQNVAHEVLCLEMLTLLLERPTDDSVEVSISFLKECGLKLTEVSPRGINAIFERLRNILHESEIDKRVQYMIEVMFAIRKDGFKDHPIVPEGLDLVEEEDQFTHMLPLEDDYNQEDILNVFKMDTDFLENEEKYKAIKKEILDEGSSDSGEDADGSDDDEDDDNDGEKEGEEGGDEAEKVTIFDQTEVNLVAFRRTIYLAIQSSLDFEECAHKLIKMDFPDSQTKELCNMILDCCAQQRTYEKFFGLLAGRFCLLKKDYMESFEAIFMEQYETIHRLETNKLRNVARMFAHLLYTDSVPWSVLECIKVSEDTTTSSSRIFVKILFQELCAYMGLPRLNERLKDMTLQPFFEGLFPRDNPRNTRFAINFFTSIGLGGLTDELREHLKNAPKIIMTQNQEVESSDTDSSSDSSSSDSDSSDSDSSDSSSDSSSSSSSSSDSDSRRKKSKGQSKNKKSDKDKKKDKMTKSKASSKNTSSNQKSPLEERPNKSMRNDNRRRDDSSSDDEAVAERGERRPELEDHHKSSRHRGREDAPQPTYERPHRDRGGHQDEEQPRGRPDRGRDYEDSDRQTESRRHNRDDGGKYDGKRQAPQVDRADHDRVRHRSPEKEKEPARYRNREKSKSQEKSSRKEKDMDSSRNSYRNGVEQQAERADKENRENRHHSDRYREPRRNEERSRDSSPRRRR
ncbi:pre-mRNA-splicing factor CWC22 homolog isoform X2 [Salmo salar]|uniref:Pre-mRNA-splicing factor CWC22 homolog n=1 Tax=Salmo salar TaxID=8030 RepID=A0A1S3PNM6_SALSA|nr:pre-mRNA-splicing factor CWC22 homolog isoform X2 [Salmo salar]|eukprot:XP_014029282.1 PREDICTED: pre-mRNA-splicing factor CWC22 homolog isoform X2 [Salmo salar]